jgi:hypothetical protein
MAEQRRELLGDDSRRNIRHTARSIGHDEANGVGRKVGGHGRQPTCEKQGGRDHPTAVTDAESGLSNERQRRSSSALFLT